MGTTPAASDITYYDPSLGFPFSFAFCTNSAGLLTKVFGSAQAQVEDATLAPSKLDMLKVTPISGDQAGKEQVIPSKFPSQDFKIKCTWSQAAEQAALVCLQNRAKGVLAILYADGSGQAFGSGGTNPQSGTPAGNVATLSAANGTKNLAYVTEVSPSADNSTGLRTFEVTISTPVPPVTFTATAMTALPLFT